VLELAEVDRVEAEFPVCTAMSLRCDICMNRSVKSGSTRDETERRTSGQGARLPNLE
jgi:hypothetical protein